MSVKPTVSASLGRLTSSQVCLIPHCLTEDCEDEIKEMSGRKELGDAPQDEKAPSMGAKSLCIPATQPEPEVVEGQTRCCNPSCERGGAKKWVMFGRSY